MTEEYTRKSVIDEARSLLGEPETDYFTSDEVNRWANQAQTKFCWATKAMRSRWSRHLATNQGEVPRPNDCLEIEQCWWRNATGKSYFEMKYLEWDKWTTIPTSANAAGMPNMFTVRRDNMIVFNSVLPKRVTNGLIIEGVQKALSLTNDDCKLFRPKNPDDESSPFVVDYWDTLALWVAYKGALKDKDFKTAAVFKGDWYEGLGMATSLLNNPVQVNRKQRPFGMSKRGAWPRTPANTGGTVPTP